TSAAILLANAAFTQLFVGRRGSRPPRRLRSALAPVAALAALGALIAGAWLPAPALAGRTLDVAVAQPDRPTGVLAAARTVDAVRDWVALELASLVTAAVHRTPEAAATTAPQALEVVSFASLPAGGAPGPAASDPLTVPDLVLIPEGAWPHAIGTEDPVASLPAASVAALSTLPPTLLGAAGYTPQGASTNSAFLWSRG